MQMLVLIFTDDTEEGETAFSSYAVYPGVTLDSQGRKK